MREPARVALSRVMPDEDEPRPKEKPERYSDELGDVLDVLFTIPALAGLGAHWALADTERDLLARRLARALKTLKKGRAGAIAKAIEKSAPWLALGSSTAIIVGARVAETRELAQEKRTRVRFQTPAATRARVDDAPPSAHQSHGATGDNGNGDAGGNGARIKDLFRHGPEQGI